LMKGAAESEEYMNKVILMGRLTRDPDIRHTQGENSFTVARFTVAVDRRFKRNGAEQQADFISCVAFRQTADFMERYFHKGMKITLSGSLQTGSYTNKDGQKVYTTDVVVDEVEFAESKRSQESYGGSDSRSYDYGGGFEDNAMPSPGGNAVNDFVNIPEGIDEELPFA